MMDLADLLSIIVIVDVDNNQFSAASSFVESQ